MGNGKSIGRNHCIPESLAVQVLVCLCRSSAPPLIDTELSLLSEWGRGLLIEHIDGYTVGKKPKPLWTLISLMRVLMPRQWQWLTDSLAACQWTARVRQAETSEKHRKMSCFRCSRDMAALRKQTNNKEKPH